MQSDVNEIGGQIFGVWPFAGGVGKDKGNVMLPQEREELRRHETIVPNFDRVTNAAGDADPGPGACFEFIVVFFPKVCCFTRVTRQQLEKLT